MINWNSTILEIFRAGQINPFPIAKYSVDDLSDVSRRQRIFDFWLDRKNQFYSRLRDLEEGTHTLLSKAVIG